MKAARLAVLAVIVAVGGVVGSTVSYGVFNSSNGNGASSLASGTVALVDNDSGAAVLQLSEGDSGQSISGCIRVEYQGSLASSLRMFGTATGGLAPYLTLTIVRGTDSSPSFNSCNNFTADATNYIGAGAGVVWTGPMSTLPTTWVAGIVDPTTGSPESWTTNEVHSYKALVTVTSAPAGQGQTASLGLTFEVRNQ